MSAHLVIAHANRPQRCRLSCLFASALAAMLLAGCVKPAPAHVQETPLHSITGVVVAEDSGKPIANALVRVSSPGIDMRSVRGPRRGLYDTETDNEGRFSIVAPLSAKISLNAFAPGYEEAAGMKMSGDWTFHQVPFPASREEQFTIKLRRALYVAGVVTDEAGQPVPGTEVEATLRDATSLGYVALDVTDANGRFEIFDYPLPRWNSKRRGQLTFQSADKLTRVIADIYALSEVKRTNLHISLKSGHLIQGRVTMATGEPLARAVVEAVPADGQSAQRTFVTGADGYFLVRGLPDGEVKVRAHSADFNWQAFQILRLTGRDAEMTLRMEPVALKAPPKEGTLLGMKLADATPELQAKYALDEPTGVVILDPGAGHQRLGIGELSPGLRFWLVGGKRISNLREMVAEILRIEAIAPPGDPNEGCRGSVRIVYAYRNRAGTNTQRLALTAADIAELKRFNSATSRKTIALK